MEKGADSSPCSAFVLVERGGEYDCAWEENVMVCLDKGPLEAVAEAHHKKQRAARIRLSKRSYMEIEEVPYLPNVTSAGQTGGRPCKSQHRIA
jgi:hypothetical protein